jgi:hypothetical protein
MKNIKLFENFDKDDAKGKAESALEGLIMSIFPDHSYANPGQGKAGDYELDQDTSGNGDKIVFANIYFNAAEFDKLDKDVSDGYDNYIEYLNKEMPGELKVDDIGSAPEDNMISISIVYDQNFSR